jgi:hypothetical protein
MGDATKILRCFSMTLRPRFNGVFCMGRCTSGVQQAQFMHGNCRHPSP